MKKILLALILLAIVGVGTGYYMYNKKVESTSSLESDLTVKASELLSEFENNEENANAKYLDKVVAVSGTIQKVENKDGTLTVYMDTGNPMSSIIFQMENNDAVVEKGQKVNIKGICTGYLMDVVIIRAVEV